jgi:hypothetical protein
MTHPRSYRRFGSRFIVLAVGIAAVLPLRAGAEDKKKNGKGRGAPPVAQAVAPPAPRSSLLTSEIWRKAPVAPVTSREIDDLVATELKASKIEPAPLTTDEQFLRRVTLDMTGKLPKPAEVSAFVNDKDPRKRAKVIDKLLDSEVYAHHWASYWRDVIAARVTDRRGLALQNAFERWMTNQIQGNNTWDQIVRAMLTAEGGCRFDDDGQHGAAFFLASHFGADAANEQAAESSRIFLGIQIQCAQCHDHKTDQWKRVQFHELAAYFARVRERPMREEKMKGPPVGVELFSTPRGEHEMPDKDDPKKKYLTHPRFLNGKAASMDKADRDRRRDLARAVTDPNNYWFAGAYVNRVWGELMGQSFYEPVDDMGPHKEAVLAPVLVRLASAFRATKYDTKEMFRVVLNTQTYQRQLRPGELPDGHLHFAAAYPTRLRADALWDALVGVLGPFAGPPAAMQERMKNNPFAMKFGVEGQFKTEFESDPSLKADEVEGSIPQALFLMNNPAVCGKLQARGELLGGILKDNTDDSKAVTTLYLRVLARKPTDRELTRCREYIEKVGNRSEAFEDIAWTLLNSTEFQTKR